MDIDVVTSQLPLNVDRDQVYAAALEATDIDVFNGRDGSEFVDGDYYNRCRALAYKALVALPEKHVEQLEELYFYYSPGAHRGYGGTNKILLRCMDMSDEEFVAVLVHEMGHVVDTGLFEGKPSAGESGFVDGEVPIYKDDESLEYYEISWSDENDMRGDSERLDFVSGYGMSNPYEDFAEAYAMYVLNGEGFREFAESDNEIKAKYLFMREVVFNGVEYDLGEMAVNSDLRGYDVTVLPYRINDLFTIDKNK